MPSVVAYHRPTSLDEASEFLSNPQHWALAGGTVVVPNARKNSATGVTVVDLQALDLGHITTDSKRMELGAMVRLSDLCNNDQVPAVLREAARRELPSVLRNQATIGGTIAQAEPDSVLVAALLVHDTRISLHQSETVYLGDYLASERKGLIVSANIATRGQGEVAVTGRTPADTPIVAAVARSDTNGVQLALSGVAPTPLIVDPNDPTAGLNPPGDFRGTAEYRIHLARVLSERALGGVQ